MRISVILICFFPSPRLPFVFKWTHLWNNSMLSFIFYIALRRAFCFIGITFVAIAKIFSIRNEEMMVRGLCQGKVNFILPATITIFINHMCKWKQKKKMDLKWVCRPPGTNITHHINHINELIFQRINDIRCQAHSLNQSRMNLLCVQKIDLSNYSFKCRRKTINLDRWARH